LRHLKSFNVSDKFKTNGLCPFQVRKEHVAAPLEQQLRLRHWQQQQILHPRNQIRAHCRRHHDQFVERRALVRGDRSVRERRLSASVAHSAGHRWRQRLHPPGQDQRPPAGAHLHLQFVHLLHGRALAGFFRALRRVRRRQAAGYRPRGQVKVGTCHGVPHQSTKGNAL
jgi:hypothetical protein